MADLRKNAETETWPRIEYACSRALVAALAGATLRLLPPTNLAVETCMDMWACAM